MRVDIDRRMFLKVSGLGVAFLSVPDCAEGLESVSIRRAARRPNVLIIHVDQHRIDCIGAYGNRDVKTPFIDSLAADGVRFENSFCPFPMCTPSRYSLLSGMYVHDHGGWANRTALSPRIATFPRILRTAGYKTKAVGKMHFMPTYLDVGFDEMVLAEQGGPGRWDDDYHRYLMKRGLVDKNDLESQRQEYRKNAPDEFWKTLGAMVSNLSEADHATTWIGDCAVETVADWQAGGEQLLMVGFIKPHHPFDPPAPWDKMYDPLALTILPGWRQACFKHDVDYNRGFFRNTDLTEGSLRRAMAYYYATISQIDLHVGRLVTILKDKGLYDDTLIVYTADHGDYMGHHHMILKGNYMYDPVVKVPLIIKWPHSKSAGHVSGRLVNNIDLAPTICRATGCRPAETMEGYDLAVDTPAREIIFSEYRGGSQVMARTQKHKLILASPKHANLFFDLEKDPLEMNNLYNDPEYKDIVGELEEKLSAWRYKGSKLKTRTDGPLIKGDNVPPADLSHRPAIIEYYDKKMRRLQSQ